MTPAISNLPTLRCPHCGIRDEFRRESVTVTDQKKPTIKELVDTFTWQCAQCHHKYLLKYRFAYYDGMQIMPKFTSLRVNSIDLDDFGLDGIIDCDFDHESSEDIKCQCDRCGKEVKFIEPNYKDYCNSKTLAMSISDVAHFEIICGKCLRDLFILHKDYITTASEKWNHYYSWNKLWSRERSAYPCFFFKADSSDKCHLQVTIGTDSHNNVTHLVDFLKRHGKRDLNDSLDGIADKPLEYIQSIENLTGLKLSK